MRKKQLEDMVEELNDKVQELQRKADELKRFKIFFNIDDDMSLYTVADRVHWKFGLASQEYAAIHSIAVQIDYGGELLNESLSEVVKEHLLYGAHPLSTEEDADDIWDDAELYNLKLTNGDVVDCSELAAEVLDALKRYLKGQPMLQSIPVKEGSNE